MAVPPDGESRRRGNHEPPKSGIPKRKKTATHNRLSCKIEYLLRSNHRDSSIAPEFFTGDEGTCGSHCCSGRDQRLESSSDCVSCYAAGDECQNRGVTRAILPALSRRDSMSRRAAPEGFCANQGAVSALLASQRPTQPASQL